MEELRVCREECDILKQKLHIHLDRWTLDTIMFDEFTAKAAQEKRLQEAENAYELARKDLLLGSQQQQLSLLKLKLESAIENSELKEVQLSALKRQLQDERKWLQSANRKRHEMKAKFALMSASENKLLKEAEKEKHRLQNLLDDSRRTYALELELVNGRHISANAKLKEEIEQLKCYEHTRPSPGKTQRLVRQQEMQEVFEEIDKLKVERENWLSKEENMQKLERERDCLQRKLEGTLSQRHDDLAKERDNLKQELELVSTQREKEVKALVRERDFVWSQMKRVEEDYSNRIKKTTGLMLQEKRENDRLREVVQQVEASKNETMIEMTAVKLGRTQAERLAAQKQQELELGSQELQSRLEKVDGEKNHTLATGERKERSSPVIRKGTIEEQLDPSHHSPGGGCPDGATKEKPEVLNVAEVLTQDQEIFESQVQQATQTDMNKRMEDLQRENENLRRETDNLKSLYAELEVALHAKRQKPSRANKHKNRDPTSRNLKLELEAAATCSKGRPLSAVKCRKVKRLKTGEENFGSTGKPKQNNSAPASGKLGVDGASNSDHLEISRRQTRSSKRKSCSEKGNSDETAISDTLRNSGVRVPAENSQKRKIVDNADCEQAKIQRPPLHKISLNQKSDAKSLPRPPTAGTGPQESENRTLLGSPSKTSKMMANLFSSSFSVPKLKGGRTPVPSRT